ncbi:hypothetical protein [Roseibacillus ishigakijimensis]|uniref:PEP-CTERM protein-sorting domain-containing protein n=1 Tax=Roseibacillus ishigakijimensis TaxID=454146 RepID=A0A934VID1_9BACT|nr:hypothetical protein [Roseibacillus ishigakijimensis]MBK1834948.1 hypothetical protein [Roseibacillus ishigakijimensis]
MKTNATSKSRTLAAYFLGVTLSPVYGAVTAHFEWDSGIRPINSFEPYEENGLLFSSANPNAAVLAYSPGEDQVMEGNATGYLGFAAGNQITIRYDEGAFIIQSLEVGREEIESGALNITIQGISATTAPDQELTLTGVTSLQSVSLGWSGISELLISSSGNTGIDRVVIEPATVPEPSSASYPFLAGLVLALRRRRRSPGE